MTFVYAVGICICLCFFWDCLSSRSLTKTTRIAGCIRLCSNVRVNFWCVTRYSCHLKKSSLHLRGLIAIVGCDVRVTGWPIRSLRSLTHSLSLSLFLCWFLLTARVYQEVEPGVTTPKGRRMMCLAWCYNLKRDDGAFKPSNGRARSHMNIWYAASLLLLRTYMHVP